MTEATLRQLVVDTAKAWLGRKESDNSHREIIDIYNAHKPLARGYAAKYTDAWCATFVSAVAVVTGLTDIIPTECGCGKMIELFKKLGSWMGDDSYLPSPGDIMFYDWQDGSSYATTDNKGAADHVGIVEAVNGQTITMIEGNYSNSVKRRSIKVNGQYIRGYGIPNYASKAEKPSEAAPEQMVKVYRTLNDVPTDYRPTILKLMEKKALGGYSDPDPTRLDDNILNLSEDFCRVLTVLDRMGVLG